MSGVVKRNDLNKFLSKLKKLEKNAPQYFAEKVASDGVEIATEEYAGTSATIDKEVGVDGTAKISASGVGLFYDEYGTGELGRNSKTGKKELDEPISFISTHNGKNVTVDEWTYSYANELISKDIPKIQGRVAKAQMFKTSQRLREKYKKNLKGD